ncbi:MAG: hypothetical protein KDN05_03520 [Verrucomicrobiae bacterium]|nr:hypothetical protein [Verrucomicrobiae bacterium]MCP5532269.1 hypothetical protein [Akkermansiaceae bacterium]MCP5542960.1 hypothetical protein [Akkermansiaceae bacterium]MCP5547748.1 hypothetical protein [Akkermansiaceae bacterium]
MTTNLTFETSPARIAAEIGERISMEVIAAGLASLPADARKRIEDEFSPRPVRHIERVIRPKSK